MIHLIIFVLIVGWGIKLVVSLFGTEWIHNRIEKNHKKEMAELNKKRPDHGKGMSLSKKLRKSGNFYG